MATNKALVIMGHGSRKASANEEFCGYAQQVEAINNASANPRYQHIGVAFLEFSPETLMQACEVAVNEQCGTIDVYPVFLTLGKHVGRDIPQQVAAVMERFPEMDVNLLEHMGSAHSLAPLLLNHILMQTQ